MPNDILEVSEEGDLYQIKCTKESVKIIKKEFVDPANFKTKIGMIKFDMTGNQKSNVIRLATLSNAPNNLSTTMNNAMDMCLLSWTYTEDNADNPSPSTVTVPDYLSNASTPSSQTGIPYCWGGFDGLSTSSSSSWSNFEDAMDDDIFAGNVNTVGGRKSGTAGLDCSGFVSSAVGFTSKLGTSHLASSTYTYSISASNRYIYDIYVKSGSHVVFYVGKYDSGIRTREATKTGDDKTKIYTRSASYIASGFSLRRFNGW
jgi:cell wall-associated NlpC family hydrolase